MLIKLVFMVLDRPWVGGEWGGSMALIFLYFIPSDWSLSTPGSRFTDILLSVASMGTEILSSRFLPLTHQIEVWTTFLECWSSG